MTSLSTDAVTKSIFFFAAASFLLLLAYASCLLGYCIKKRGLYTFVSGVVFIISGLVMLFGLIMYISVFKAEVGYKLRPRSQLQPPAFTYSYGYSFLLYVCGFIGTQVAGISAIFLFINKAQYEYRAKHLEDLRRGKLRPTTSNINYLPLEHAAAYYPCQRHPQSYVNTNSIHVPTNYPSPAHQRRYFFSKEPIPESPCSLHRARADAAAKDAAFYDFPPPPTISYQFDERASYARADTMRSFPRDVTTHTVSTTADVIDEFPPDHHQFDDYSPGVQHEHEFVTFDLDQPLPLRATQSTISINSRNGRKDYANDTLRRTTPVWN